jgi:hypothetical protein
MAKTKEMSVPDYARARGIRKEYPYEAIRKGLPLPAVVAVKKIGTITILVVDDRAMDALIP